MLKIENLSFAFGKHIIFKGLSMDFEQHQVTGILGKNGVGKTTLFRVLAQQYTAAEGSIILNDRRIRKSDISFLPTDPYFYPYIKGQEYLSIVNPRLDTQHDPFDLPLDDLVETYSTGMRKKLAFVAILQQKRPVIILDEPFNGVDLQSNEVLKLLLDKIKQDKSVIIASHMLHTLTDICDVIYYIRPGYNVTRYKPEDYHKITTSIKISSQAIINKME